MPVLVHYAPLESEDGTHELHRLSLVEYAYATGVVYAGSAKELLKLSNITDQLWEYCDCKDWPKGENSYEDGMEKLSHWLSVDVVDLSVDCVCHCPWFARASKC